MHTSTIFFIISINLPLNSGTGSANASFSVISPGSDSAGCLISDSVVCPFCNSAVVLGFCSSVGPVSG